MIVYTSQKSKILFNDLTLDLGHERKKDNKNTKHTTKSWRIRRRGIKRE